MSKPRIITSVINNFDGDQRVQKVCKSLRNFGYSVQVIATDLHRKPKLEFDYPIEIIHLNRQKGILFYLEFNWKLFWKLKKETQKGDVLLANDLDALLPNYLVSKFKKVALVFDSHEIFSEMPTLTDRPLKKKIWKSLEKFLLPKMRHFYTVSDGYADWFEKEYQVRPEVIRNVPFRHQIAQNNLSVLLPTANENEKILLYQGAVNFSRGIDKMILAMQYLNDCQLWIVGDGPMRAEFEELTKKLNLKDRVFFIGHVSPSDLRQITPLADLGLSLEEDYGISYRYALPNKIFDYSQAGIPILGTDLPEIKNTIEKYGIGKVVENHEAEHIAQKISEMLKEGKSVYAENLKNAAEIFNWENQEERLKAIFEKVNF